MVLMMIVVFGDLVRLMITNSHIAVSGGSGGFVHRKSTEVFHVRRRFAEMDGRDLFEPTERNVMMSILRSWEVKRSLHDHCPYPCVFVCERVLNFYG